MNIQVGDYIIAPRFRERMRVIKCYNGPWTLKPMVDCQDPILGSVKHTAIYVEDIIQHFPKHK